jgi:dTDP-glucose 4,6-dehydratase
MRVIITGGAGFIGSNLVRLLVSNGTEVLNIDKLTYAGNLESLSDIAGKENYRFAKIDICDAHALTDIIQTFLPDAIIHLAAESHVDRSIDGPRVFIETNIVGTYNLLQASLNYYRTLAVSEQTTFRFLHVSTDEVYGTLGPTGLFTEESRYDPHSPYSASKASSDHLVRAWSTTYKLPVIVTHSSNNYGPFQYPEKLVPVVILKCLIGEKIPIYGNGRNVRDWLYVLDHCVALQEILLGGMPGESYNISSDNEMTNLEVAHLICETLDELLPREGGGTYKDQITFVPDRPGHDFRYALDNSKIKEQIDWEPTSNRSEGFRETVKWYLANEAWWQPLLASEHPLERRGTRN